MLENILLAIVLPLVNAGEYFVGYCHGFSECWISCSSICWANFFLIAFIYSRELWLVSCPNGMFVSCGIFKFVAGNLEVSWSERGRDS